MASKFADTITFILTKHKNAFLSKHAANYPRHRAESTIEGGCASMGNDRIIYNTAQAYCELALI